LAPEANRLDFRRKRTDIWPSNDPINGNAQSAKSRCYPEIPLAYQVLVVHSVGMAQRRIFDDEHHAQFVTISCYRRRRLLDHPRIRDDFMAITATKLREHRGVCSGFVVMPNHVHVIIWFGRSEALSPFMQGWKQTTSLRLKRILRGVAPHYAATIHATDPFWQAKYYPFNLYAAKKAQEKLDYMHLNPVRAGLVERAVDWKWSSAAWYENRTDVGIPIEWVFE
jgi:putative transposase